MDKSIVSCFFDSHYSYNYLLAYTFFQKVVISTFQLLPSN